MGGRYLITGVQIGMLESCIRQAGCDAESALSILREITDLQFIGDSSTDVKEDAATIREYPYGRKEKHEDLDG